MCIPVAVALGIGVALSAASTIYSGMASAAGSESEAQQYELQRLENKTATSQASRDRFAEFSDLEDANQVAMAASGFSAGSFGALTRDNRATALEDAKRIEDTGAVKDGRLKFAAGQARSAAKAHKVGAVAGSLATLAGGYTNIKSV